MKRLTYTRATALLRYEPETGDLYWRQQRGRVSEGQRAGSICRKGGLFFRQVHIDGRKYGVGPVAWLLMTKKKPKGIIDFRNNNPMDTRWENLVLTDYSGRALYASPRETSKTGISGVTKSNGKWRARAVIKGVEYSLGLFGTKKEARKARQRAVPSRK